MFCKCKYGWIQFHCIVLAPEIHQFRWWLVVEMVTFLFPHCCSIELCQPGWFGMQLPLWLLLSMASPVLKISVYNHAMNFSIWKLKPLLQRFLSVHLNFCPNISYTNCNDTDICTTDKVNPVIIRSYKIGISYSNINVFSSS